MPIKKCPALLEELSAVPTAPGFEHFVKSKIRAIAERDIPKAGIFEDSFGNLLLKYENDPEKKHPSLYFVAHMDHPAFKVSPAGEVFEANRLGHLYSYFMEGCLLDLHTLEQPFYAKGKIESSHKISSECNLEKVAFATLDLGKLESYGNTVEAPVLDDYLGLSMTLDAMQAIAEKNLPVNAYGLFTRLEEEGFQGAREAIKLNYLPKENSFYYSIEAASYRIREYFDETYNTAVITQPGAGAVLREGDRRLEKYNEEAIELGKKAMNIMPAGMLIKHLAMSGGSCEATDFCFSGYKAAGVSIPTIALHNNGNNQQPEVDKFVKEKAAISDIEAGEALMEKIAEAVAG